MKWLYSILWMLILPLLFPVASVGSDNDDLAGRGAGRVLPVEYAVTSGPSSAAGSSLTDSSSISHAGDFTGSNPGKTLIMQQYITPEDPAIKELAGKISESKGAYKMAVQWTYVSDENLNRATDKWLTPHEFLINTPQYPDNPLQGYMVSDCEEKANTLVSLIRAKGVPPEEVRVVLGEVKFNKIKMGHAWVELLTGGHWLALDPCWGPYWDGKTGKLVRREGIPFDYYASHTYPVLRVWTYYNDVYYLNLGDGSGNAPASWRGTAPATP